MERWEFTTLLAGAGQAPPRIAWGICQCFGVVSCYGLITLTALLLIVSAPLSIVVASADPTLEKGYVSKTAATKGIVLYLHGCDGGFNTSPAADWHDWFERSGFKVFAPNSFAEERPPASCSAPYPNKDKIYAIRFEQTKRVLEEISREYAGILWRDNFDENAP